MQIGLGTDIDVVTQGLGDVHRDRGSFPRFLVACQNSRQEVENLLMTYSPEDRRYVRYQNEYRYLRAVRQHLEDSITILRYAGARNAEHPNCGTAMHACTRHHWLRTAQCPRTAQITRFGRRYPLPADSSLSDLLTPREHSMKPLRRAASRWQAAQLKLQAPAHHLDGPSVTSVHRCIVYLHSGAIAAAKQLLCEPAAYTSIPVRPAPWLSATVDP
jgi:hypothetical protein